MPFGPSRVTSATVSVAPQAGPAHLEQTEGVVTGRLVIHVEGHTDAERCRGSDACNWYISAQRAAAFRNILADPAQCPGAQGFRIVPVGYGDTRPVGAVATRRIEVRLVPDYEAIIAAASEN